MSIADERRDRAALYYEHLIVAQYRAQKAATPHHLEVVANARREFDRAGGKAALDEPARHRAATKAGHRITGDLMLGRCACDGPECVAAREAAKSARGAA